MPTMLVRGGTEIKCYYFCKEGNDFFILLQDDCLRSQLSIIVTCVYIIEFVAAPSNFIKDFKSILLLGHALWLFLILSLFVKLCLLLKDL